MDSWLAIPIVILVILTLASLFLGIGGFVGGGRFNNKYGNLIMRFRVGFQLAAVLLLMLMFWLAGRG